MDENKTRADLPDEELDSVSGGKAILPPGISVRDGIPYVCDKCGYEATLRFDPYAAHQTMIIRTRFQSGTDSDF